MAALRHAADDDRGCRAPARFGLAALALLLTVAAPPALAQSAGDSAVYIAVVRTPLGALPRTPDFSIVGERAGAPRLYAVYGMRTFRRRHVQHGLGIGGTVPVSERSSLSATLGYWHPDCDGCDGHPMAEMAFAQGMARVPIGDVVRSHLAIGLRVESGFGIPRGGFLWAGRTIMPLALVPERQRGPRFVPWIAPGVAIRLARDEDDTDAGITATASAGVGLLGVLGARLSVGVDRAWLRGGGNWMVGVGVGSDR